MHGEGDVQQVAAPAHAAIRVCKTGNARFTTPGSGLLTRFTRSMTVRFWVFMFRITSVRAAVCFGSVMSSAAGSSEDVQPQC